MGQSLSRRRSDLNLRSQSLPTSETSPDGRPNDSLPTSASPPPPKQSQNGASSAADEAGWDSERAMNRRRSVSHSGTVGPSQVIPRPKIRERASSMRAAAKRRLSSIIPKRLSTVPRATHKASGPIPSAEPAISSTRETSIPLIPPASPVPPGDAKDEFRAADMRERGDDGSIRTKERNAESAGDYSPEHSIPSSGSGVGFASSGVRISAPAWGESSSSNTSVTEQPSSSSHPPSPTLNGSMKNTKGKGKEKEVVNDIPVEPPQPNFVTEPTVIHNEDLLREERADGTGSIPATLPEASAALGPETIGALPGGGSIPPNSRRRFPLNPLHPRPLATGAPFMSSGSLPISPSTPRPTHHHHHHHHGVITQGTQMIVQGVVQTSDLARGMHQSRTESSLRRGRRLPRPASSQSRRPHSLFSPDSTSSSDNERNTELDAPPTSASDPANDGMEGIEVLTMLLGVVTAATGASLMNGTTAPDLSSVSNVVRSDDAPLANAEASTISHPPLPIPTTLPQGANAVSSPSSSPSRPRHFLRNMRSRLLSRLRDRRSHAASRPSAGEQLPGHMPADTETNGPNSTPIVVDRGSVDEAEQLAALRANISQQLTRALARHAAERHAGSSTSTPFRSASPTSPETPGSVDPAGVPLPPDDSLSIYERPPSPVARAQGSPVTPRTPAILTGPSEPITPPPLNEQSFEAFLNDIQTDLRATLMRRHEQERRVRELRERMEHSSSSRPLSVPRIPAAPSLIPDLESRERTGPDRSSFTLPPNYHLTEHVPSVDTPLNWWRMFRFPPRTIQASPGVNLNPNNANPLSALRSLAAGQPSIPGPGPSSPATTHVPLTTSPFPVSPPITPGTTVPPSAPSESTTLTPVLIVGLRQQNTQIIDDDTDDEAPSDLPMYAPASPSSPFAPRSDFSTTSTSSLPPAPRASTSSDTTVRHPPRTSLFPHRRTSSDSYRELSEMIRNTPTSPPADLQSEVEATYGETWRQNLRAFLASALARGAIERAREERAARREERRLREAEAQQARESYVIWVIGGYYPENMLGAPNLLLGQFDHDDFWALAEFLGQVKPPVATREDIEKAGLEVIKKQQLAEYLKGDKIAPNTSDRCLICLSEYEDDEEVRIMSCKHGFHKDCVDKWMEVGRNNCPACRTKGVPTENTSTLANNSSPSAASSA